MSSEKSALFALSALRGDKGYAISFFINNDRERGLKNVE